MFVCKQKTAYEMRISDWSSDVCSSGLDQALGRSHRRIGVRVEALQLHQAHPEHREQHRDDHEAEAQPEQGGPTRRRAVGWGSGLLRSKAQRSLRSPALWLVDPVLSLPPRRSCEVDVVSRAGLSALTLITRTGGASSSGFWAAGGRTSVRSAGVAGVAWPMNWPLESSTNRSEEH